ncbi:hypothetical protein IL252_15840 [Halomicrobium sp. IBSBa]|uniref:hypothetical protein n=1 Tax=Halomicrobium sp. IBSBa TaxID=2778916 RepID=UPI001ABFFB63|nr:hypothetical protein [Halomicrobium sp. IBSBa]MBO4249286.1 hypothetical protein [Halomicrobium sp. IBSBa]
MGVDVFLIGMMLRDSWDDTTVAAAHEALTSVGLKSTSDREGMITYEITANEDGYSSSGRNQDTVSEFTQRLYEAKSGDIHYEFDSGRLRVTHRSSAEFGDCSMPVGLGGLSAHLFDPETSGDDVVARRTEKLYDAFVGLSEAIDPDVASLVLWNDHGRTDMIPEATTPSEHDMNALPWLLLLSEPWIDYCGGREHVLQAPVYDINVLDTGSILLRVQERPSVNGCRYESGFEHLFD